MTRFSTLTAIAALVLATGSATAQSSGDPSPARQQDRIGAILGALFGDRTGATTSIEAQWAAGRMPLSTQRVQFESRVDADVRSGALSQSTGSRLKYDYYELVQLEARYGADRRFTTQERSELAERYAALSQVLTDGSYRDDDGEADGRTGSVADGQSEFVARVNAAVSARRITRVEGNRLRADYAAVVQTEASYMRDGRLTSRERDDLDAQLDALDARVGDIVYPGGGSVATPQSRLDAIARALPSSGLSATAQTQLRVEHEDLTRLASAYARLTVSSDERSYLERRLGELETRVRIRR